MSKLTVITPTCFVCSERSEVEVNQTGWDKWQSGLYIQDAFPEMSADEREMLLTGTHPECWAKMFPPEEEE